MKILHAVLRPGFGICLFLSQFTSNRNTIFTDNLNIIVLGVLITIVGVSLCLAASIHLGRAKEAGNMSTSGPFQYIRHPIYTSIYYLYRIWIYFLCLDMVLGDGGIYPVVVA